MVANIEIGRPTADEEYWNAVRDFYAFLPTMNDAGVSGYFIVKPQGKADDGTSSAFGGGQLYFVNQTDPDKAQELLSPILTSWKKGLDYRPEFRLTQEPKATSYLARILSGSDDTGGGAAMGSRLISRELLDTADGPAAVAQAFKDLDVGPTDEFLGARLPATLI